MLEAVLPLMEADLERSVLLRESLQRHGVGLGTCWVIAPDRQVARIARALAAEPRWVVIGESDILPPVARRRFELPARVRQPRRGWYFQQVLKLAAVARSKADFCITLDADVIAVRDVTEDAVAPGGRAWSQLEPPPQAHPHWYDGAARLLDLPRSPHHNAVTPAVLSPGVCRDLIARLDYRRRWIDRDWVDLLLRSVPWSEYALYNTFIEGMGRFSDYHVHVQQPLLYGDPVWFPEDFDRWGAGADGSILFTLVQSTSGVSVDDIRTRLGKSD